MTSNTTAVVVVDDEAPLVELVCDVLEDAGIHTTSCRHGQTAYACIQRKHPDLVILDVQMPGVDGIQLFQWMRAKPETACIPVIFFTANAHLLRTHLPNYAQQGAHLLPKPFDIGKLIATVEQVLDNG